MLIKESILRRIIREEARRALREDDAIAPVSQPNSSFNTTDPGKPVTVNIKRPAGYVNPNAPVVPLTIEEAPQAIYNAIKAPGGRYKMSLTTVWSRYIKGGAQTSILNFQFQINTDGSIAPNTIKVTCTPDLTSPATSSVRGSTLSADFKKEIALWKFGPVAEAFVYQHPNGMKFDASEY